ncbi:hypothetical protein J2128_002278 [Methanomicrobium sp. W14]|uniref:hypothetical protein n=1 Tax=Methanomicrobium sp. W14 TaxID=2817839 RepID=UPI001AE92A5D|nr:hypothetical protein [Methanomicrobium sp. W14]MBP2134312.1 hypothetical protein [Methanomicrobium sp. W14]
MDWCNKNLENILDETCEMHHLNELLLKRSENKRGATADDILNNIIHPTLDDLEYYLRYYLHEDTTKEELKRIIFEWIEAQKGR